uniref:Uncharacterized protein n=1 Tax=Oryza sativa subsp. japonica TaxID=39947 RepID=Q94LD4_ORYSJ|nr:hypothetical protein [Oryza sativa Japonica Group]
MVTPPPLPSPPHHPPRRLLFVRLHLLPFPIHLHSPSPSPIPSTTPRATFCTSSLPPASIPSSFVSVSASSNSLHHHPLPLGILRLRLIPAPSRSSLLPPFARRRGRWCDEDGEDKEEEEKWRSTSPADSAGRPALGFSPPPPPL